MDGWTLWGQSKEGRPSLFPLFVFFMGHAQYRGMGKDQKKVGAKEKVELKWTKSWIEGQKERK